MTLDEKVTDEGVQNNRKENKMTPDERDTEQEDDKKLHDSRLRHINPNKLKPHPKNKEIYDSETVDDDLVDSIRKNKQLEPIILDQNKKIISGHRRWRAIQKIKEEKLTEEDANIEAICVFRYFSDDLEREEAIVESNRQREKSPLEIYKESKLLHKVYAERAEQRRRQNLPNLKPPKYVDELNSVHREEMENVFGRTMDKVAEKVGYKRDRLAKLILIGRRYDEGDTEAIGIMNKIKSGELSIDAAYKKLKLIDISKLRSDPEATNEQKQEAEEAEKLLKKIEDGNATPNKAWEKLEKSKEKNKEKSEETFDKPSNIKLPPGVFNVIVADPPDIKKAMKMQITTAIDAALFLWANNKNLEERLELMKCWGFDRKAIAVWETDKQSGTWFVGSLDLLLFGVKGNMEPPDIAQKGVVKGRVNLRDLKSNVKLSKEEVVYVFAENMFPGKAYCDPYVVNGREGWGQPTLVDHEDTNGDTENNEQGSEVNENNKKDGEEKSDTENVDDWL
jgi:ParB-like chromosome segregation protein Spo0J/N6-adenosine-specific RNA methylase IME4